MRMVEELVAAQAPPTVRAIELSDKPVPPFDIEWIIERLDAIPDLLWRTDTVRNAEEDGTVTNCVMGHLHDLGGGDEMVEVGPYRPVQAGGLLWGWFEESWATTYRIYPVNDGTDPDYPQATPRERVVAFLRDLCDGRQLTTYYSIEAESDWRLGRYGTHEEAKAAQLEIQRAEAAQMREQRRREETST